MVVPMQLALNNKLREVAAALDADPGAVNVPATGGLFDGRTLLMCAASRGHVELAEELLRRGADAAIAGRRNNETAESLARGQGHEKLGDILAAAAARGPQPQKGGAPQAQTGGSGGGGMQVKRGREDSDGPSASIGADTAGGTSNPKKHKGGTAASLPSAAALAQMAQLGNVGGLCRALDADPGAINRPAVGGLFDGRTLLMCAASRGHAALV